MGFLYYVFNVISIMIDVIYSNKTVFLRVKLDYLSNYCIKIPLYLSNKNNQLKMLYETANSQTSIIYLNEINYPTSTKTTENKEIKFPSVNNDYMFGDEFVDFINPSSIVVQFQSQKHHFINTTKYTYPNNNFNGILGLGRNYTNDPSSIYNIRFSYLHYLFNNKWIERKIFSHNYLTNISEVQVLFGAIPLMYKGQISPKCKSINSMNESHINHAWNCPLHSIRFENNSSVIIGLNKPVIFSTGREITTMPFREGMSILIELEQYSNHSCQIEPDHTKTYVLICSSFPLYSFPQIYFNFGEFELKMKTNMMFRESLNMDMISRFKSNFVVQPLFDYWVIGGNILRNVDMAFDYDNDEVIVFNGLIPSLNQENKENYQNEEVKANYSLMLMIILVGLVWIGIIMIISIKLKMKSSYII